MKTKTDLTSKTSTIGGAIIKEICFSQLFEMYFGEVWDETSPNTDRTVICTWKKNGKCVNPNRADLNLK